ncbi:MAG: T9SS type A sorting domain-containing protein [Bacteroidia bacterium]
MQAQALAGDEQLHLLQYQSDPTYQRLSDELEAQTYQQVISGTQSSVRSVLTIPVVVHIMHPQSSTTPGSAGHPTDLQIEKGINWLNQAFRNQGSFAGGPFYSTASQLGIQSIDTEIEFCLAKVAPDGSVSTGITRTGTDFTNVAFNQIVSGTATEDQIMKALAFWDSNKYLNLWVVNSICEYTNFNCDIPGYAYLPGAHGTTLDGVVLEEQFFGSSAEQNAVGTYFFARYLNLWRTSYRDLNRPKCDNTDCAVRGDRVCDTPPDSTLGGPAVCGTLQNSCDSDSAHADPLINPFYQKDVSDIYENFMDLGGELSCKNTFTEGQKVRMRIALQTTRQSLLAGDRCTEPKVSLQIVNWKSPAAILCEGNTSPQITILNNGSLTVTQCNLKVSLNGQIENINWQGSLAAGDELNVNLSPQNLGAGSYTIISEWTDINGQNPDPQAHPIHRYTFWVVDASVPPEDESKCVDLENGNLPPRWKAASLNAPVEAQVVGLTTCASSEDKVLRIYKDGITNSAPENSIHWVVIPGPVVDPSLAPMQKLSFDWAHQFVDSLGSLKAMILSIPIDNCNAGIDTIWQAADMNLNTASAGISPDLNWWPQECLDWQTQEVDLSASIQSKRQLVFAFGFSSQYLMPAYMDNICWEGQRTCPEGLEIPTEAGVYRATYTCQDPDGWTHFVKSAIEPPSSTKDQLLFSVKVPQGQSLKIGAEELSLIITDTAAYESKAPYVQNNTGFYTAGRYVQLDNSLAFDSTEFEIRFYFDQTLPEGIANKIGLPELATDLLIPFTTPMSLDGSPENGQMEIDSTAYTEYLPLSIDAQNGWELQTMGDFYGASMRVSDLTLMGIGSGGLGLGFGARYPQVVRSFTVNQVGAAHVLNWQTDRELLADHFEVLHSLDGESFSSITSVPAQGLDTLLLNPSDYLHKNELIEVGYHYYTVLLHHSNGYTTSSDTLGVSYDLSKLVRTYPNPVQDRLTIAPEFEWTESLTLQLFDSRHMVFLEREWTQPGEEVVVDIPNIPPGIYFFQVQSGELKIQGKLLKTH